MRTRKLITTILAVLAVALTVAAVASLPPTATAVAQPERPDEGQGDLGPLLPPPGPGDERGFERGRGGPRGRRPGGPGMPGMNRPFPGARGGAALAVHGDHVYVLSGNTLYQFAAEDLGLVKKVTLQEERPFGPPRGPRRGPGEGRPDGRRPPGDEQE